MHAQSQQSHKAESRQSTQRSDASQQRDKKAGLRGLSFAEGEKALSPDPDRDPADPKTWKRGVPPEIEALGLKHVKVECTPEAWLSLSEDEKEGVISFLVQKEAACESDKDLKRSRVEIGMGRKIKATDETDLADKQADAATNQDLLRQGKSPMGDKTIGVKEGPVEVTQTPTTRTTDIPITESKTMEDHIDAAGSTFNSADYKPEDMREGGVNELLEEAAQKILGYLAIDPNAVISLTVIASESHVPNPAQFKEPGSLAAARAANAITLAQAHFGSRGIPLGNISFTSQNLGANGPAWDPKVGKDDPSYTAHQFVRLSLSAQVEVDTGEKKTVTETVPGEKRVGDSQIIKMSVEDKHRMKLDGGGKTSFEVTKNNKRYKSDAPKNQRGNNANECGP